MNLRLHHCAHGVHYQSTNLLSIYANVIHIKCTASALCITLSSGSLYHKLKNVLKIVNVPTTKSVYSFALKVRRSLRSGSIQSIKYNTWAKTPYEKVKKSTRKCRKQESQEVSPFHAGDHKLQQPIGVVKSTDLWMEEHSSNNTDKKKFICC